MPFILFQVMCRLCICGFAVNLSTEYMLAMFLVYFCSAGGVHIWLLSGWIPSNFACAILVGVFVRSVMVGR